MFGLQQPVRQEFRKARAVFGIMDNTYIVRHRMPYCDMPAERRIVFLQNKNTRQAKSMIAIVTNNLPVIMPIVWAGFATYAVWRARRSRLPVDDMLRSSCSMAYTSPNPLVQPQQMARGQTQRTASGISTCVRL